MYDILYFFGTLHYVQYSLQKPVDHSRVSAKIDNSGNVGNKGIHRQNKFSQKNYHHWGLNLGPYDCSCGTFCVRFSYLLH